MVRRAAAAVLLLACLGTRAGESRVDALAMRGARAAEDRRWSEAERAYREARKAQPERAELAARHAAVLARLGCTDEALTALTEAAALGYASPYEPRGDEAFDALRADPRFVDAMAVMEKNDTAARRRVKEADTPLPAAGAPVFASLADLRDAFTREERGFAPGLGWEASEVQIRSRRMRKIAALERYLADHAEAADRAEASLEGLRVWSERALWSFTVRWPPDLARDLRTKAAAFGLAQEARFYALAADVCAAEGGEGDAMLVPPPAPGCESALDGLAGMAADAEAGPWGTRAAALHAICLEALGRASADGFRAAQTRWTAAGLHDADEPLSLRLLDGVLQRALVASSLRLLEPPNFALTSSTGKAVTLHGQRSKVVLLDFWSPG